MVSSWLLYVGLLLAVAGERIIELFISRANETRLRAQGAEEHGRGHYPVMVVLHALFLPSCALEVWFAGRPFIPLLAGSMLVVILGTMALRYWVVTSLQGRWCTRVLVLPDAPLIEGGPFRWLPHPNYLAVVIELAAIPLFHTAWVTALVFGTANAVLLAVRIRVENRALGRTPA